MRMVGYDQGGVRRRYRVRRDRWSYATEPMKEKFTFKDFIFLLEVCAMGFVFFFVLGLVWLYFC